jgi:hypothetical protein
MLTYINEKCQCNGGKKFLYIAKPLVQYVEENLAVFIESFKSTDLNT